MSQSLGIINAGVPWLRRAVLSVWASSAASLSRTMRSPLFASGRLTAISGMLGSSTTALTAASTALRLTISPPILAKRA